MKTHNKMMIGVGALALIATTLLAGCGGSSTEAVPAAEPAAVESAAAEVPTSVLDGLVQPAGVSDDDWAEAIKSLVPMDNGFKDAPPEDVSEFCGMDMETVRATMGLDDSAVAVVVAAYGGTEQEWSAVFAKWLDNAQRIACSLAK